jgi:NAD(P)-dependent dehydrogenase (short-subunit alcohol dehydrogenase family)
VICNSFAAAGANIAVNYFNREEPAQKVKSACESHGVKAVVIKADMCSTAEAARAVEQAKDALGGLDIVIANAVGFVRISFFKTDKEACCACA